MILREHHRVLAFGGTGRQGTFWVNEMIKYGVSVAGSVNPRKAGTMHLNRPVYASANEAAGAFDVALMFVPPLAAKDALADACRADAKLVICLTEFIPTHDVMEMIAIANASNTRIVGPNTAGMVTPGETFAGIMPAFNDRIFLPGQVGVISRSGSLGALACLYLTQQGIGQSAFVGVGGDPVIGTSVREALEFFENDAGTTSVVICGEIGGSAEEESAEYASGMRKGVVAFIAGRSSPIGKKMGHAGAIVDDNSGSYDSKRRRFEAVGVAVAHLPSELPNLVDATLSQSNATC